MQKITGKRHVYSSETGTDGGVCNTVTGLEVLRPTKLPEVEADGFKRFQEGMRAVGSGLKVCTRSGAPAKSLCPSKGVTGSVTGRVVINGTISISRAIGKIISNGITASIQRIDITRSHWGVSVRNAPVRTVLHILRMLPSLQRFLNTRR